MKLPGFLSFGIRLAAGAPRAAAGFAKTGYKVSKAVNPLFRSVAQSAETTVADAADGNYGLTAIGLIPGLGGRGSKGCLRVAACRSAFARVAQRLPFGLGRYFGAERGVRGVRSNGSGARYPLHPKIQRQIGTRGWTTGQIDQAIQSGQQVKAINKATNNPATRYVHPKSGQSVVVDDLTGQVIHVGGPGFKYGTRTGDVP